MRRALLCGILIVVSLGSIFPRLVLAADADPPAPLATGVAYAGELADGRLLCCDFDGACFTLDPATGARQPWRCAWTPQAGGWTETGGAGFAWKLAVSPDGLHVALATGVGVKLPESDGEYPAYTIAIILAGPDGADAKCAALAEVTDGGPPLDFTRDSARLAGPWFIPCEPTAAGFQRYIAHDYEAEAAWQCNYLDTAGGRGLVTDWPDFEFYAKSQLSDYFVFGQLDVPGYGFASITDPTADVVTISDADNAWLYYEWVLPDALLVSVDSGAQQLVYVDGKAVPAPVAQWHMYTSCPDGACIFSDDRGQSVKYGKVDWPTFSVDWWVDRPELAQFAEPLDDSGWPERQNQWLPLRDGKRVAIIAPGEGELFVVQLSREGARP